MPIDSRDYKNLTDYLQHLYQCQPFARNGIEHPVTIYYPAAEQIHDVDSLLDPFPPAIEISSLSHATIPRMTIAICTICKTVSRFCTTVTSLP